jgi:hypothetical protein
VARPAGLEPAACGFEVRRSIRLSYGRKHPLTEEAHVYYGNPLMSRGFDWHGASQGSAPLTTLGKPMNILDARPALRLARLLTSMTIRYPTLVYLALYSGQWRLYVHIGTGIMPANRNALLIIEKPLPGGQGAEYRLPFSMGSSHFHRNYRFE